MVTPLMVIINTGNFVYRGINAIGSLGDPQPWVLPPQTRRKISMPRLKFSTSSLLEAPMSSNDTHTGFWSEVVDSTL